MRGVRSIAEARQNLPSLVDEARRGRPVTLTRRGTPVAVLMSVEQFARLASPPRDLGEALRGFRARYAVARLGIGLATFAGVRDRSPGREVKP